PRATAPALPLHLRVDLPWLPRAPVIIPNPPIIASSHPPTQTNPPFSAPPKPADRVGGACASSGHPCHVPPQLASISTFHAGRHMMANVLISDDDWSRWLLGDRFGHNPHFQRLVQDDVNRFRDRVLDAAQLAPNTTF